MLDQLKQDLQNLRINHGPEAGKNVLRVIIGDIETAQSRANAKNLKDEDIVKMIKKLIASNEEVMDKSFDKERNDKLQEENDFLLQYLPEKMSIAEVRQITQQHSKKLARMKQGPATGCLIKHIKQTGKDFEMNDVQTVLRELLR